MIRALMAKAVAVVESVCLPLAQVMVAAKALKAAMWCAVGDGGGRQAAVSVGLWG
jgi:hypothetical protein